MVKVIISLKIMPDSPETNLENLQTKITEVLKKYEATGEKFEKEPIAFGIVALNIGFMLDENNESTEPLQEEINSLEEVNSVELTNITRALG